MSWVSLPAEILLELVYPHHCLVCGRMAGLTPFVSAGSYNSGLRPWDRPHLCCHCYKILVCDPPVLMEKPLLCGAATRISPNLVELVGQWKYHGIRGLGWPLSAMLVSVLKILHGRDMVDVLLPIPLHKHRRRERGFNQAEMLARLAGLPLGLPVVSDLLIRQRNTGQQARLKGSSLREKNIQGAFRMSDGACCGPLRIGLIDDLLTTGSTALEAARTLETGGFDVRWVAALGIASQNLSD